MSATPSRQSKRGEPLGQWRVAWTHAKSGDQFVGEAWDRETAEHMRDNVVKPCPSCVNVRLVRA